MDTQWTGPICSNYVGVSFESLHADDIADFVTKCIEGHQRHTKRAPEMGRRELFHKQNPTHLHFVGWETSVESPLLSDVISQKRVKRINNGVQLLSNDMQ